jgi:hypothetical protein
LNKRHRGASSFIWLTLVLLAWQCAEAQLVATKDLTNASSDEAQQAKSSQASQPAAPTTASDKTEKDNCNVVLVHGAIPPKVPEKLRLEIVNADPKIVHPGSSLLVTVRLVNVGANSVLVPWDTPLVKPDIEPETGNLSWDAASISLYFATQGDRRSSRIKGEALLVAAPSRREQHVELLPGQWLDVKFKAAVECDSVDYPACDALPANRNAELTADWWERLSTYEDDGCNKRKGTYELRTVNSEPLPVVYDTPAPTGKKDSTSRH